MFTTPAFLRRHRRWLVLLALVALFLLARMVYMAMLPAPAWLDRGWHALVARDYPRADACFQRAQALAPESVLPRLAVISLVWRLEHAPPSSPIRVFCNLPWLGTRLAVHEDDRNKRLYDSYNQQSHAAHGWINDRYGIDIFRNPELVSLFYDQWHLYPREIALLFSGFGDLWQGESSRGWDTLARLEHDCPRAYASFAIYECILNLYAHAAWRNGHFHDAERIWNTKPKSYCPYPDLLYNLRLSPVWPAAPARVWRTLDGNLQEVGLTHRQPAEGALLPLPARHGAYLLQIPSCGDPMPAGWWQWNGQGWQPRALADRQALAKILRNSIPNTMVAYLDLFDGAVSWSATAEYLSVYGHDKDDSAPASRLLRIDHGIEQVSGYAARDICCLHGDVWVHGENEYVDFGADGPATIFCHTIHRFHGNAVTPPQRPRVPFAIAGSWQFAHDGTGRLWLVNWDGGTLFPRAVWEGQVFRRPTRTELAHAAGGFRDTAGRLWYRTDFPPAFRCDGWRSAAPGLPPCTAPADYAVDARHRVWVISDSIAACWDGTWHSVAHRLPGNDPSFTHLVAAGNGVFISTDQEVCYLE